MKTKRIMISDIGFLNNYYKLCFDNCDKIENNISIDSDEKKIMIHIEYRNLVSHIESEKEKILSNKNISKELKKYILNYIYMLLKIMKIKIEDNNKTLKINRKILINLWERSFNKM
jgi:hypothetical protein